jgi:phenylacetate-CoA ligase
MKVPLLARTGTSGRIPRSIPLLPLAGGLGRVASLEGRSASALHRVQERRLQALLDHAVSRVPYYRETVDPAVVRRIRTAEELSVLPVLERSTVQNEPVERMLSDRLDPARCHDATTSGSSGTPRCLYFSEHEMGYLRASYVWDMMRLGVRPRDRVLQIRPKAFRGHRLERFGILPMLHIDTRQAIDALVDQFLAARPTVVSAFPSVLLDVVEELDRRGERYADVHTVIFAGEPLLPAVRQRVLTAFDARYAETYSTVEVHTIARSCPRGALHVRTANVVVEVEHDDGSVSVADGVGDILVTRLQSDAMPLLRYRLGDRVEIGPDDCGCSTLNGPIVHRVMGRTEDRVIDRAGRRVDALHLIPLFMRIPHIALHQLQQREPGKVEIHVVPGPDAPDTLADEVTRATRPAADLFDISVHLVRDVIHEPSGKIRVVKDLLADATA